MAKLVDALVLGTNRVTCGGSSPLPRTVFVFIKLKDNRVTCGGSSPLPRTEQKTASAVFCLYKLRLA